MKKMFGVFGLKRLRELGDQVRQPSRKAVRWTEYRLFWMSLAGVAFQTAMVGCAGIHAPHPVGRSAEGAVRCDKCRTIWVSQAEPVGKLTRYSRQQAMVCDGCESAVVHWMKTGDLRHYCSHCKGHMTCDPEHKK